ncbi:MAG: N-acetylmuramoyl-L-alanine amidase, partial [Nitrospirae bacterium]
EMKVVRLSLPPRLVIDAAISKAKGPADVKPQSEVVLSQKVFVFDPGHGGYDFGIVSSELKEKDIVLAIAKEIETVLLKWGKTVFLTRKSDQSMQLRDRAIFANQKMPEIFISIHIAASENFVLYVPMLAGTGSEQSVPEMYALSSRQKKYAQKSRKLAEAVGRAVKEEFNLEVIQREMPLPVLDSVGAPAVLIEAPSFKIIGYDQKTRARLAEAIVKGLSYYGQ